MGDYIRSDGIGEDAVERIGPLKANRAIKDAAQGLLDTIMEQVETEMRTLLVDAVEEEAAERGDERPDIGEIIGIDDLSGQEVGTMLTEASTLDRVQFIQGFLDRLGDAAMTDLHREMMRR